jgi:CHAT domain-containing protein
VLHEGEPKLIDLGPTKVVEEAVQQWRKSLNADAGMTAKLEGAKFDANDTRQEAGRVLRALIWEPLEKHIADAKTVIVSPDGPVSRIPLAALPGKSADSFLLEELAVVVYPVPNLLSTLSQREIDLEPDEGADSGLLLLGAVNYDAHPGKAGTSPSDTQLLQPLAVVRNSGVNYAPLPGTAAEIEAVEQIFRGKFADLPVTVCRGQHATEDAFRRAVLGHGYVHLATHGFFTPVGDVPASPSGTGMFQAVGQVASFHPGLMSGVVLTGANRGSESAFDLELAANDGILTALEMESLDLHDVNLAVLSACQTGLGKTSSGEGVIGLQRAMQVAGVKTAVTSLWKVDDNATKTLMIEFYKNLWEKKLAKLDAFRQAQLTMISEYDSMTGRLRGPGTTTPVDPNKLTQTQEEAGTNRERLSPFFWAAFVLSGEWQ